MSVADSTPATPRPASPRYPRAQATQLLRDALDEQQRRGTSARAFARAQQLPPSTLQRWRKRYHHLSHDPEACAFFESPAGLAFLQRLVVALHLVFALQGGCGLRLLGLFLHLTGLDRYAAASFGACQQRQHRLEQATVDFGLKQRQVLAPAMTPRPILLAEDETFHPTCCLVALEPVSGFVLVEQYAAGRDQEAWDQAVTQALVGLSVTVVSVASDEAKGLVAHVQHGLGAPHAPDLFHVQADVSRDVGAALAAQTRQAHKEHEQAQRRTAQAQQEQARAAGQPRGVGRPIDHAGRVAEAEAFQRGYRRHAEACVQRQEAVRAAVRGLGADDHPFDLSSGEPLGAPQVQQRLQQRLDAVAQVAAEAKVQTGKGLRKAQRLLPLLAAVVSLFWGRLREAVAVCYGAGAWGWVVQLVGSFYLQRVARQTKGDERRKVLRALAERLRQQARALAGQEPPGGWALAERRCREWAGWFGRSSSAVEGRNGQLRQQQHGCHHLSDRKLAALTALHNYWLRREDGTTAAERFFGTAPEDLFAHLLCVLPVPARPAQRRPKAA